MADNSFSYTLSIKVQAFRLTHLTTSCDIMTNGSTIRVIGSTSKIVIVQTHRLSKLAPGHNDYTHVAVAGPTQVDLRGVSTLPLSFVGLRTSTMTRAKEPGPCPSSFPNIRPPPKLAKKTLPLHLQLPHKNGQHP